jgi:twitching motility two-component system response regulator PilG
MATALQSSTTPAPKVLVADPDGQLLGLYAGALGTGEYEIFHATDGREALVKLLEHRFALVITETQLPLIDGYALCELIRRDSLIRTMPIIVVTDDARQTAQRQALIAGADVVLVKPWTGDELLSQAKRLILKDLVQPARMAVSPLEPALEPDAPADGSGKARGIKSRAHKRYDTSAPPAPPPALRCPSCDRSLSYTFSHVGGVSAREPEQWDYFTCPATCGQFQYRQRTRRLQRV